jgi:hypothetical protein
MGRQLLNRVPSVAQDTGIPVNKGHRRFGGTGVFVTNVQRHQAGFVPKLGDIDCRFVFGTDQEGQFVNLTVVMEFSVIVGHGYVWDEVLGV